MIGTYAAVLAVCAASLGIGQAAVALCGGRRWSWLSPAIGLALLSLICWTAVRVSGEGAVAAALVAVALAVSVVYLWGRVEGAGEALRAGAPVALVAFGVASLPFLVAGHFGILGTGFNPDMSQHLLATDGLVGGGSRELLDQGYPLGPHSIVVALEAGLGIELAHGFSGLTVAVAILAPLTALSAFAEQPPLRRTAAALLVGLPYLVASYFAQGSFKETMQALYVLAFVLALRESAGAEWRTRPLRFVPAALIAVGAVYTYSFAGLVWLVGIAAIWAAVELARGRGTAPGGLLRAATPGLLVLAVGALPEIGRMIDFQRFETFDPNGPGLGNLFGQASPFTALGIWFSGDFRVAPGDGVVPALAYYLGGGFALALLVGGVPRLWRSRESAVLAGVATVAGVYLLARLGGTVYTSAKALEVAAPLLTLAILLPLIGRLSERAGEGAPGRSGLVARASDSTALATIAYIGLAGLCSVLVFANAPVGPSAYSAELTGLRPAISEAPTLVVAPDGLLDEEEGSPFIFWELRGGRVCVAAESEVGAAPPAGVRFVISWVGAGGSAEPPFPGLTKLRTSGPYVLWERPGASGPSPCPLIEVRQARQGPALD